MFPLTSRALNLVARRAYSQSKPTNPATGSGSPSQAAGINTSKVTGLSNNCVKPVQEPVGPGASHTGAYKVSEYFCFNRFSYNEAEVELAKYRLPQPSAIKK